MKQKKARIVQGFMSINQNYSGAKISARGGTVVRNFNLHAPEHLSVQGLAASPQSQHLSQIARPANNNLPYYSISIQKKNAVQ